MEVSMSTPNKVLLFPKPTYLSVFREIMAEAQPLNLQKTTAKEQLADIAISYFLNSVLSR